MADFVPILGHKRSKNQSGRPDLNRRPLDPQDGGSGGIAAQSVFFVYSLRSLTCSLFSMWHSVWSPDGPQGDSLIFEG
jgi:hypothetical protein